MLEKKLNKILEEAKYIRQHSVENKSASYFNDSFINLSKFILKKLNNPLFKNENAKIIADHFDEILPYIALSNINILLLHFNLLIEQPNFKEKFIEGLKKYPYIDKIDELFYHIWICLYNEPNKFDNFIDNDVLRVISTMDVKGHLYLNMLNRLNEENQRNFLNLLVENKCDIPYSAIEYKGNNKEIIYDNLSLFIEKAQNLYNLMDFVKDNPIAFYQVKDYIDNNEEKAINSIFCETDHLKKMKDPTLKEMIKIIVLEVIKNEKVKLSDITYNGGGFSRVLLIGNKVIKLGSRFTKRFPNNPYIITPLLRQELEFDDESCFVEVTERVDTDKKINQEELYQLFKNLRILGLIWTDIKEINVGRLKKENIIHWQENLSPSEEVLGLDTKRGETILKEGDLVVLDADFIYDENDPKINYTNNKEVFDEFEKKYQEEKENLLKFLYDKIDFKRCIVNKNSFKYEGYQLEEILSEIARQREMLKDWKYYIKNTFLKKEFPDYTDDMLDKLISDLDVELELKERQLIEKYSQANLNETEIHIDEIEIEDKKGIAQQQEQIPWTGENKTEFERKFRPVGKELYRPIISEDVKKTGILRNEKLNLSEMKEQLSVYQEQQSMKKEEYEKEESHGKTM